MLEEYDPFADLMDDDTTKPGRASVMATFDVGGGGSASWELSAKPEVKLSALMEISNNLGKTLSVDEILPKLLDSLFKIFTQADRGFVVMRPKVDGPLVPVAVKSRREGDDARMRISRTIVEEAMKTRKAILSADAASDERFGMAQSIADFSIRSMICAPMIGTDGQPIGVIQIDTLNQRSRFTDDDLEVLASVASQAAVSIDNAKMHEQVLAQQAMQRDLELARRMQRALLPAKPPRSARLLLLRLLPVGPASRRRLLRLRRAARRPVCRDRRRRGRQRRFGCPADGPAVDRRAILARQRTRSGARQCNRSTTVSPTPIGRTSSSR